jgi:hypothetical protein
MSRYLLRTAAAGAVALLAGLFTAPSASADIQRFPDVGEHITGVRVSHGPSTVGVTAYDAEMTLGTYYHFWLDTNPNDPGPEYKAKVHPDSDGQILFKVANFASGGIRVNCPGASAIADTDGPQYAKIFVPRSCIGTPSRVRVTVVGYYDKDLDNDIDVTDWAPGEQRAYAWVNR